MPTVEEQLLEAILNSLKGNELPTASAMAVNDSYLFYNVATGKIETITKQLAAASTHFPMVVIEDGWVKKALPISTANLLAIEANDEVIDKVATDFSVTPNIPVHMTGRRKYLGDINGAGTSNYANYEKLDAEYEI